MAILRPFTSEADNYTVYGAAFGFVFPVVATWLACHNLYGTVSLSGLIDVQRTDSLLWIIDSAPFWLGLFARFAGKRQDIVNQHSESLEQKIEARTRELAKANEAKSQFLATMSHEVRTPLNGILGSVQLLLMESPPEAQKQLLEMVQHSATSLITIINDILDYTKLETGRFSLNPAPLDLKSLCAESISLIETTRDHSAVALSLNFTETAPHYIEGDSARIRQILNNLISNALKFTHEGTVDVRVSGRDGIIRIDVIDTGIGIHPDAQQKIFERFSQADGSINRTYGGTGLGLAICKKLAQQMDGDIQLQSTPGKGSTFSVSLAVPATDTAAVNSPVLLEPDKTFSGRVLLTEDNPVNQKVLAAMLEKLGLTVSVAGNGAEAIHHLKTARYDLLLMDINMPVLDGVSATKAIRQMPDAAASMPIIAMTANAFEEDLKLYRAAGMDDVIIKPIQFAALATLLEQQLG